jgi:predicted permease
VRGAARGAVVLALVKLFLLPALALVVARWGFGLTGLALAVVVMMAALPVGSNALIFSQRYATLQSEASAAIVFSTLGFVVTAPLWLAAARYFG